MTQRALVALVTILAAGHLFAQTPDARRTQTGRSSANADARTRVVDGTRLVRSLLRGVPRSGRERRRAGRVRAQDPSGRI